METWRHISKKKSTEHCLSWLEQSVINILPKDINHGALVLFASFRHLWNMLFPLWWIKIIRTCHKTLNCIGPSIYFLKHVFIAVVLTIFSPKQKLLIFTLLGRWLSVIRKLTYSQQFSGKIYILLKIASSLQDVLHIVWCAHSAWTFGGRWWTPNLYV